MKGPPPTAVRPSQPVPVRAAVAAPRPAPAPGHLLAARPPVAGKHVESRAATPPPAHPAQTGHPAKKGLGAWVKAHKVASAAAVALLLISGIVTAALLIRQDVTTNPSTTAPDVKFLAGTDYTTINAAGFATLTLGTSGASATLALSGVSGAALVSLGDVMKLQNTDATQAYTVSLARSAALNAAITSFTLTIKNGATTLLTWDAASAATSGSFTLPVSTTLDISISLVVTDGTAAGALGSFGAQFSLAPV